jgi:hypothetical protein
MSSTVIIEAMVASSGLVLLRFPVALVVGAVAATVAVTVVSGGTDTVAPACTPSQPVEEVKAKTEESCSSKLPGMIMLPLPLALPLPSPLTLPLPLLLPPLPLWLLPMPLPLRLEEDLIVDPCMNMERVLERVRV